MSRVLPSNRKVRHFHGISLRNLSLAKSSQPRGQTIDDEYIPATLRSPSKLLAQKEAKLGHSQSFADLKSSAIDEERSEGTTNGSAANGSPQKAKAKRRQTIRRRSTLSWSHETPENRQRLLQEAVADRRVDSFFTLHVEGYDEPLYISEVKHKSMNADFQHFDLSIADGFSRLDHVIIKIWAARSGGQFSQLLEANIKLPSLVWLGGNLEDFDLSFADNAVIFHMSDGVYTLMNYIPNIQSFLASNLAHPQTPRSATLPLQETSSFDALMKLKDLAECIDDAVTTQAAICTQIETIIKKNQLQNNAVEALVLKNSVLQRTKTAAEKERHEVGVLREEKSRRVKSLQSRRLDIAAQRAAQSKTSSSMNDDQLTFEHIKREQQRIRYERAGQFRRVAQELLNVFPIEPIEDQFLCFKINNLYLPNAQAFEDETNYSGPPIDADTTAAALGLVAQVVVRLEIYLGIALPYEPFPCGSTSTIFDPLSAAKELGLSSSSGSINGRGKAATNGDGGLIGFASPTPQTHPFRLFPLYQQGSQPKRFRWAIYLLNKDIEELMQHSGCGVVDPRTTLANLKYLLSVLASGQGEMPGRKIGVIKGLDTRS